jgi:DNA processing protein
MPDAANHTADSQEPPLMQTPLGLLALQALPGVGPAKALRAAMFTTNYDALMTEHASRWKEALETAHRQLDESARHGVTTLSLFDERYPARLRAIHDPPPLLYLHGSIDVLQRAKLAAVVGTREPTSFGCSAAEDVTAALAALGWAVVSGLAKGIDTVAHGAALKHGTETIAVLAGGLDHIYPAENKELAAAIVDRGGALVAEQCWGTRPHPSAFVQRNRIQTALSAAVVVAQTGVIGGTMHTARHAAAQGRPVFCPVPHAAHEKNEGLRALLEEPARRLCALLPAWKDAASLCARLGDQPLAHPVTRDGLDDFRDALALALDSDSQASPQPRWWPEMDPPSRLGRRDAVADDDNQASLFALVD